jgi:alpha-glucan,water dikinase
MEQMAEKLRNPGFTTKMGEALTVDVTMEQGVIVVSIAIATAGKRILHWGLGRSDRPGWMAADQSLWPASSAQEGTLAVQTPMSRNADLLTTTLRLQSEADYDRLYFVLYDPSTGQWDNNGGKDYTVNLRSPVNPNLLDDWLERRLPDQSETTRTFMPLDSNSRLAVALIEDAGRFCLLLASDKSEALILHWGIVDRRLGQWRHAVAATRPPATKEFDQVALRTPLQWDKAVNEGKIQYLELDFSAEADPKAISFLLFDPLNDRWYRAENGDFFFSFKASDLDEAPLPDPAIHAMTQIIIEHEMTKSSWTLMHRFNLCHDLLGNEPSEERLAMLYVWLRYSELRQLDWQRRYNTKPRELSHAQDRLTLKATGLFAQANDRQRLLLRMLLSTLGRGGEGGVGQQIRDEILHIMHRHKIKECTGHFLEEWHQKLHNNTTPDDVVICQAYLEFLRTDGNLDRFYQVLEENGVPRERLQSYERPIKTPPDFAPHLKQALIWDFEHYLTILQRIHDAADLQSAVEFLRKPLTGNAANHLQFIMLHRGNPAGTLIDLVYHTAGLREELMVLLQRERDVVVARDLLYLDIAVSDFQRTLIESQVGEDLPLSHLGVLVENLSRCVNLWRGNAELGICHKHWAKVDILDEINKHQALKLKSVSDRIARVIGGMIDDYQRLLGPSAAYLGSKFEAQQWVVDLFVEAVIRGSELFSLSTVLRILDARLRETADLGDWQVISPAKVVGEVVRVNELASVQDLIYEQPTILICDRIGGEEEPPQGVVGILTTSAVDVLSHLAVRTRTYGMLFATCYSSTRFQDLKNLNGRVIEAVPGQGGAVIINQHTAMNRSKPTATPTRIKIKPLKQSIDQWILSPDQFGAGLVGGKSLNLMALRGKLPESIGLPASLAIPFGTLDRVCRLDSNRRPWKTMQKLQQQLGDEVDDTLVQLREQILSLQEPEGFRQAVTDALSAHGLPPFSDWQREWRCIKKVWASKWNKRAYLSRKACGIRHEEVDLAVLVQTVIEAEYAFVIHTVNPFSGNRQELYAEVVLGLGETLVSGEPGRAMSFTCDKKQLQPQLLTYPNKSRGLYGTGLIFRSDSNAEDLENYAGAGLYDSFMLKGSRQEVMLRYREERLFTDDAFCNELLRGITQTGLAVEQACAGKAQDIEGVYRAGKFYVVQTRAQMGG